MTEKSKTTPCPAAHTRIGNIKEFEYTPRISLCKTGDQNDFVSKPTGKLFNTPRGACLLNTFPYSFTRLLFFIWQLVRTLSLCAFSHNHTSPYHSLFVRYLLFVSNVFSVRQFILVVVVVFTYGNQCTVVKF